MRERVNSIRCTDNNFLKTNNQILGFYFSLPVLVSVQADVRNIILFSCHLLSVIVYCQGYHGDSILVSGIGTGVAIVNVKLLELLWKVFYH